MPSRIYSYCHTKRRMCRKAFSCADDAPVSKNTVQGKRPAPSSFAAITTGTTVVKVKWNTFTSTGAPVNEADIESMP